MSALEVAIDYGVIAANVSRLRDLAQASGAEMMAVVKADGYGHGVIEAGRAAREGGATWLGVAQPGEALALRAAGDAGRVFTWLYGPEVDAAALLQADVDVSVASLEVLDVISAAARSAGVNARVHLCVDTGLGREGATPADLPGLLDALEELHRQGVVTLVGVWSHLAWADAPGHPTIDAQAEVFRDAAAQIADRGIQLEVQHLANSACTLTRPDLHFNLVRPGIAIYGLPPVPDPDGQNFGLIPAMSVTCTLALVKQVPAGHGVSYGHEYHTETDTTLGLVSAGYSDGIFRAGGNRADVAIDGRRYRIAGRVCMDQFVVDLGPDADVHVGAEVVLIGPDGPTAADWAQAVGTIDYEVVCRFGGLRPKVAV